MKKIIAGLAFAAALSAGGPSAMAQTMLKDAVVTPYPDPQCTKPEFVKKPKSNNDAAQVSTYNAKIQVFNRDANAYNDCVRTYIDKANNEVTRIHDQAGEDQKRLAETANANMQAIKDKIQHALTESNALIAVQNSGGVN
jgi:outer membrane murein-binding lipoprotein Lpp